MGNWMSTFTTAIGRGYRAAGLENGVDDVVAWEGTPCGVLSPLVVSPDLETRHSQPSPLSPPPSSSLFPLPTHESPVLSLLPFSPARRTLPPSLGAPFRDYPAPPSNIYHHRDGDLELLILFYFILNRKIISR